MSCKEVRSCNELVQDFNDMNNRHNELIERKRKNFIDIANARNKNAARLHETREKCLTYEAKLGEVERECENLEKELKRKGSRYKRY